MSIKEKETEKKNELIKQTNSNLKEQLKIISKQIEAAIENKKNNSTFHSQKQIQYDIQKTSNFNYKINEYKKKIEKLKNDLNSKKKYLNLQKDENDLKNYQTKLNLLQEEHDTLKKIIRNQKIALLEIEKKYSNKSEIFGMSQKIKNLKEENKIMKDFNKNLNEKIKNQNNQINKLNNECNLIKDNIDNKKNNENILDENFEKEVEDLKITFNQNKNLLEIEKKIFVKNLNKKEEQINKLNENINQIKLKIFQKKQEQKVNLLKIKEIEHLSYEIKLKENNEINQRNKIKQFYINKKNKNMEKIKNLNNYMKNYSNNNILFPFNKNYTFLDKPNLDIKFNKINKDFYSLNPISYTERPNNNNNIKLTNENNNNENKNDINVNKIEIDNDRILSNTEREKEMVYKEIENLKNDIRVSLEDDFNLRNNLRNKNNSKNDNNNFIFNEINQNDLNNSQNKNVLNEEENFFNIEKINKKPFELFSFDENNENNENNLEINNDINNDNNNEEEEENNSNNNNNENENVIIIGKDNNKEIENNEIEN
jgi:hypothetical protein